MTVLTIGGADKLSCRVKDVRVTALDGTQRLHGPLSWALGTALGAVAVGANWITVLGKMDQVMQAQGWLQPLLFHGPVTDAVSYAAPQRS